jgi:uncharacterized protein (DUF736 family)
MQKRQFNLSCVEKHRWRSGLLQTGQLTKTTSPARSRRSRSTSRPRSRGPENDKAPDYRIFAGQTEFGAAWKKTSGAAREYLSVKLDDPSFPAPIYASLVAVEGAEGYSLIWARRNSD